MRSLADHQRAGIGEALQPRREVWRLADDISLLRRALADQLADYDKAGRDANPHLRLRRRRCCHGEAGNRVEDRQAGLDRQRCIVLMSLRVAEIAEHPVAHVFGDVAAEPSHPFGDGAMVGADQRAQILGIGLPRQRRRADEITEHHRQLPPLGGVGHIRLQRRCWCS
jgi:hypothetical protein